jgi:hypothetical protein
MTTPTLMIPLIEARAALRMVLETVEEEFGPRASLESEEAVTAYRGPLLHHEAEALVDALRRVAAVTRRA